LNFWTTTSSTARCIWSAAAAADIGGRKVLANIDELPQDVDLAVFTLPAAAVREAVEGCVRRKVKAAVIFASGFAEVGSDGTGEQDRIAEIARAGGLALVGPNCLGFMNFVDGFAAVFFSPQPTPRLPDGTRGAVAIVAQSGGLGSHLQSGLDARGVPVSCWISTGNEAGLGLADFIQYLLDDPVTQVIALYAEDIRRPQEFIDVAGEALRRGKPIVMMHPGRGARRRRRRARIPVPLPAITRSCAHWSNAQALSSSTRSTNFMDVSEVLARFPKPSKGDLGILTFSGAFCGIAHDFCEDIGVHVPPLSPDTLAYLTPICRRFFRRRIRSISAPRRSGSRNFCRFASLRCCATRHRRPGDFHSRYQPAPRVIYIEGIVAASKKSENRWRSPSSGTRRRSRPNLCNRAKKQCRAVALVGPDTARDGQSHRLRQSQLGIGGAQSHACRVQVSIPNSDQARNRNGSARRCSPPWAYKSLRANSPAAPTAAVAIADRVGYPVAMKAQAAELTHKTEAGGVDARSGRCRCRAQDLGGIACQCERAQPGLKLDGVLVEAMSPHGLELVVGARRDPRWGPVLMLGLGGIWVEALGDVRLMAPDLTEDEIAEELGKLKTAKLLHGFRNYAAGRRQSGGGRGRGARTPHARAPRHHRGRHQSAHGPCRRPWRHRARCPDRDRRPRAEPSVNRLRGLPVSAPAVMYATKLPDFIHCVAKEVDHVF
jgi:succinyl-CoA synthetase alpha subunit